MLTLPYRPIIVSAECLSNQPPGSLLEADWGSNPATQSARRVSGIVRVNVLSSFALRWLLPRLSRFQEAYSSVEVKLSTTSRKFRYVGTAFDIGIRAGVELAVCSPRILRDRPVETAHDLRRHVLLHSTTTRSAWPRWFSAAGVSGLAPIRRLELDHIYLQLVMRGKSAKLLL